MRRLLVGLATVAALSASAVPAGALHLATDASGGVSEGVAADTCRESLPEDRDGEAAQPQGALTGQTCDSVRVVTWNVADACWTGLRAAGSGGPACEPLYGQRVSSAQVDAFEGSWVELAHRDQHRWADPLPLDDRSIVATHNSSNSLAYGWSLSRMDANQSYPMHDQLRMGVRRLELDVHWFLDPTTPAPDDRRPVLCHARSVADGTPVTEHFGCTVEFALADGLAEIDAWLDAHRDAFVMLRFETHLDGAGYAAAAVDLRRIIGDHLFTPELAGRSGCTPLDTSMSASDVLASDRHVLAVSDCGPPGGGWSQLVWDDGAVRREATYDGAHRDAFRAGACPRPGTPRSDRPGYPGTDWIRFYNDATWLSATADRADGSAPPADATPADAAAWMRCGVNQPSFDFLTPTDGRLAAMVWSWAPQENLETGRDRCAVLAGDGRLHSERCASPPASERAFEVARGRPFGVAARPYLCRSEANGGFTVTSAAGPHDAGATVCATEFPGSVFAAPRTAREADAADAARVGAGADEVWLELAWDGTAWR